MKKVVSSALLFFSIIFTLLSVYFFMLPERSQQLLQAKVADTSDAHYHCDQIQSFNSANDKKIAEELNAIHQSELMSLSLIQNAAKEFGIHSQEVKNLTALKDYQDSISLTKVESIINRHGWPGPERIGAQNNYTLYTSIQNSDLQTQQKFIPVMEQAVKNGALSPTLFANLIDRKALTESGFQIFGTQLMQSKEGSVIFSPIAEEQNVNERRKEIGLSPIVLTKPQSEKDFIRSEG